MMVTGRSQRSFRSGLLTSGCLLATGRVPVEVGALLDYDPRHQTPLLLVLVPSCPTSTFSFSAIETNSGGPAHKMTALCRQAGRPGHKNLAARLCSGHRPRAHKSSRLCADLRNGQHKIALLVPKTPDPTIPAHKINSRSRP